MRKFWLASLFGACAFVAIPAMVATTAKADDDLTKLAQNPKEWVMPTGDYANHRYSALKQINAENVHKLQVGLDFLDRRVARA